ncbi:hypothetical protein HZB89_01915, partial [archaeon]|nr:hypothetical protein [archaeon]
MEKYGEIMKSKALSPVIGTLILIGVALVVAGITVSWAGLYAGQQTKAFGEKSSVSELTSQKSAAGLSIKSAQSSGRIIIANNSGGDVNISTVILDGNIISIPLTSVKAGGIAGINLNTELADGQSIGLVTSAGGSKETTLSSVSRPSTMTASFSDLLDNTAFISLPATTAVVENGAALNRHADFWANAGDANLTNSADAGVDFEYPFLALKTDGTPAIIYDDGTDIYYVDWNGSDWVT